MPITIVGTTYVLTRVVNGWVLNVAPVEGYDACEYGDFIFLDIHAVAKFLSVRHGEEKEI